MSKNNLQELNEILFETLRGVKEGKIKVADAKAINEISGTIINSAKVQLDAIKVTKGGKGAAFFGIKGIGPGPTAEDDTYELKKKFAQEQGYDNVAAALKGMGTWEFENEFKKWKEDNPF